jgi:molybdopterin-containing oxidoreductase family iron-sulfur binding subunit
MSDEQRPEAIDRRRFLSVLGVSGAGAAVLSGCSTDRVEKLVPYLVQSEEQVPGLPTIYASTCTECSSGCGLHVRTREGRAIKLEGNPEHPINAGRLCARGQASLQGLYNPGRLKFPMQRNAAGKLTEILWNEVIDQLAGQLRNAQGAVAVVSGAGPGTFDDLLAQWVTALGGRLIRYDAFDPDPARLANQRVFGRDEIPALDFAAAKYILSFGADFLETWGSTVENQRGFAAAHGFNGTSMARFVAVSPRMDLTAMNADEWVAPKPGTEASLALALAAEILGSRADAPADAAGLRAALAGYTVEKAAQETGVPAERIKRIAADFAAAGPSLAVAGGVANQHRGAVELAAAVNVLNHVAGNVGRTVKFGAGLAAGDGYGKMLELIQAMNAGQIKVLIVHQSNPLFTLPKAAGFAAAMAKVPFKVSTSLFFDETAAASDLLAPDLHSLEKWDDARPRAGVYSLLQPAMAPVYPNVATGDVLLQTARKVGGTVAAGFTAPTYQAHLESKWADLARSRGAADPGEFWRTALQHGGVFDPAPAAAAVKLAAEALPASPPAAPSFDGDGDVIFVAAPSSMYYDGRGANRPWLLENPDPVTKITWHSWVEVHPEKAAELDVREGEILRIVSPHGAIEAPVYVYRGLRPDVVSVPIGLGHTEFGEYAKDRGVNPLDLLSGEDGQGFLPYLSTRVKLEKTGRYKKLAKTEGNPRQLGRHITEAIPLQAAAKGQTIEQYYHSIGEEEHEVNTERELEAIKGFRADQVEGRRYGEYAVAHPIWGMTIDLSRCTGCSACVTACYAENNIPHVGEENVLRGRELSWMRIERYFEDGEEGHGFSTRVIPMLCQHCENAPCESVCPVYAAYHTADGLNGQVYNRCVGTRYCANNCPYKVRYFNWYAFAKRAFVEPLNWQLNPDVTVRARGIMEKCTFCIQRIRGAQHQARLEDRPLKDGDVITACAQACPSEAIVFGNLHDPESKVVASRQSPREYRALEELNTRPAITYLARVLNRAEA